MLFRSVGEAFWFGRHGVEQRLTAPHRRAEMDQPALGEHGHEQLSAREGLDAGRGRRVRMSRQGARVDVAAEEIGGHHSHAGARAEPVELLPQLEGRKVLSRCISALGA